MLRRDGREEPHETIREEVFEIEHHIHGSEHWFGGSATHESLTAYTVDSGDGAYGTEVEIFGASDTPYEAGMVKYDVHRVLLATLQHATPYVFELSWGTTTFAAAQAIGCIGETMFIKSTATGAAQGGPVEILMPQVAAGTKLWVRIKNATNTSTITFFVGIHEYTE